MIERLHPLTLTFRDPETERAFAAHSLARVRQQGRVAILVGTLVYLLYGLLDHWRLPSDQLDVVWAIRMLVLLAPATVYLLTYHPSFDRHNQALLAGTGLAASFGLMAILWRLPVEASAYFYPGLVLATFYTYNFIGVRFPNALAVNIAVLLAYNVIFGYFNGYPVPMLISHNFFFVSANLIGGGAGYLAELQRRQLYLREVEIDLERRHHLERSLHDRLTGLPNRELLEDRISQLLARARRDSACHAGFFVDLDGFKAINDTLGHDHGDAVLRAVAERMKAMARQTDTVSRIGGDEFFVLAHDVGTREAAAQMAEKLLDCVVGATPAGARGSRLGASIGICRFCGGGAGPQDAGQIIRDADQAMYAAKAGGKNRHAFAAGSPAWP